MKRGLCVAFTVLALGLAGFPILTAQAMPALQIELHPVLYFPLVGAVVESPPPVSAAQQIAAGWAHTCAVTGSGGVKCWGRNTYGQLGDGTQIDRLEPTSVIGLPGDIKSLAAGGSETCALTTTGAVFCWGANWYGQLGDGTETNRLTPVGVKGLDSGVEEIRVGEGYACALMSSGGVRCWGWNDAGQLGDGTYQKRLEPVTVRDLSGVKAIATATEHTCALLSSGKIKCWGFNGYGQFGNGTKVGSWLPMDVTELEGEAKAITANSFFTCAVMKTGGVKCWGDNTYGQLGDGTHTQSSIPVDVFQLSSGMKSVAAGAEGHTCGLTNSGGVKCWGGNWAGQVGDGTDKNYRETPVNVTGIPSGALAITAGFRQTCALLPTRILCWGSNEYGQVGDGTQTNRLIPVDILNWP